MMKWPHSQGNKRLAGAVGRRQWKLDVVLSSSEIWWTGVSCLALYIVSLYGPAFVAPF